MPRPSEPSPREAEAGVPQAHTWIWAMLPATTTAAAVVGDPELAVVLREAGLEVHDASFASTSALGALVVRLGSRTSVHDAIAVAGEARGETQLIVAAGGGSPRVREGTPRWRRALELIATLGPTAQAALSTARMLRRLRRKGWRMRLLCLEDRSRSRYDIAFGGYGRGVLPSGWAIGGARREPQPSAFESSLRAVSEATGLHLSVQRLSAVETDKLLAETRDTMGREYMLRVAASPSRRLLNHGLEAVDALQALRPPSTIADRLVLPVARGAIGAVSYSLEPKAAGEHPESLTDQLWSDCVEFLVELHGLDPGTGQDAATTETPDFRQDIETIAPFTSDRSARERLDRLASGLEQRLAGVPLGWEHGDFWPRNVLIRNDRLHIVLDWETAESRSLPLLDLFDLISLSGSQGLTPGPRCLRIIWPLARAGGNAQIRAYCDATGTPADTPTLDALAQAFWVRRVARELRDWPDRRVRPVWLSENVHAPIAALGPG